MHRAPFHLAQARVLVVGDVMLDRYGLGSVDRISPEAPVPVVHVSTTDDRPGGAANVARNVVSVGARASLLSVVGADEAGGTLRRLIEASGIDARLHVDERMATTVKLRVIAQRQQVVRVDFEAPPPAEVLTAQLDAFADLLPDHRLLLLSDYGKGGLTHIVQMIDTARRASKPILIDPMGSDYARYAGATMITPNRAELRAVVGAWSSEEDLEHRAQSLRRSLGLAGLLLTRSEEGMTLFSDEGAWSIPAQAREVFDVSGAGDTVIATIAAMLAADAPLKDAIAVANRAAGIVVGKLGTATASHHELFGPQP
ncbi:MAG: D-glycero-beta-D-manno-heptose-7-phosphate kinase [Betaproteobacteria bacterium]